MSLRPLDGGLHIARGPVDALAEIELNGDVGVPLRTVARDKADAGNLRELFLQRRRDRVRHRHWIRARKRRADGDDRVIDCGQIVNRQLIVSEKTEDEHGD